MNRFLVIPCAASLLVFATVAMVRGSQNAKESTAVRSVSSMTKAGPNQPLLAIENATEAILDGWPSESRMAFFSRRGPTSRLSASTNWHYADSDSQFWQANAFIGELVIYAQTQSQAKSLTQSSLQTNLKRKPERVSDATVPAVQQLPICVDRVTGTMAIHANGQWQPYEPWLNMNLPKLKKATNFASSSANELLGSL